MALQDEAESVERATGVAISVYGFDAGPEGMPGFCGDYRDHPDQRRPGECPMDAVALREELKPRTTVVLGDVRETIQSFRQDFDPKPIGFVAIDADLYSSSSAAPLFAGAVPDPEARRDLLRRHRLRTVPPLSGRTAGDRRA
jgi:hypothetical protein